MADSYPRIYAYDLPPSLNSGLIDAQPSLRLDFWYVEPLFHQNLKASGLLTQNPDEADFFFIPFYPNCSLAAFSYAHGWDPAYWTRIQRHRCDLHVLLRFRRAMQIVRAHPSWKRHRGRRHWLVFGQGRGANCGNIWRFYKRLIADCTFLAVEARPRPHPAAFRAGHDVVIPGFTPWQDVIDQVNAESPPRDILIHFRGRSWGDVRPQIFRNLRPAADVILSEQIQFAMGGENRRAVREDAVAYYREARRSVFCLCPAGQTPWSKRIYETILCGAIPVFIPGTFVPPFPGQIDFSRFSVTITMEELPRLEQILRGIPTERVQAMLAEVARVRHHFVWHETPVLEDAFHTLVARFAMAETCEATRSPP